MQRFPRSPHSRQGGNRQGRLDPYSNFRRSLRLEVIFFSWVVQHYQKNVDGLVTVRLGKPLVKKEGKYDFIVDLQSFKKGLNILSLFILLPP